jgi:hypothetical protein
LIRILRYHLDDELRGVWLDKSIKDLMLERGYSQGFTGIELGLRFMEFDGASMEAEFRDYECGIVADALATRVPNTWFDIEYRIEASRFDLR